VPPKRGLLPQARGGASSSGPTASRSSDWPTERVPISRWMRATRNASPRRAGCLDPSVRAALAATTVVHLDQGGADFPAVGIASPQASPWQRGGELELELIQSHVAQKAALRTPPRNPWTETALGASCVRFSL